MLSKNDIKFIRALSATKQRRESHCFVAEGSKIINELLDSGWKHRKIFTLDSSKIHTRDQIYEISEKNLGRISNQNNPQDALAIFEYSDQSFKKKGPSGDLILACDRIQDPGNLGTMIRIADWFGIDQIICSKDCADVYNPKVVQSTMGSLAHVQVFYVDLKATLNSLKEEYTICSTSLDGENIYDLEKPAKSILVMGNESKGVSDEILKLSTQKMKIPSYGKAESLNVAIATGIVCAEYKRRN